MIVAGIRKTLRIAEFRALLISYVINRAGDVFGSDARRDGPRRD